MGCDVVPLPIGIVMARCFDLKVFAWPVLELYTQFFFRFFATVVAVQIFKSVFKRIQGLAVQGADQYSLPVVPCIRANAANIAHG